MTNLRGKRGSIAWLVAALGACSGDSPPSAHGSAGSAADAMAEGSKGNGSRDASHDSALDGRDDATPLDATREGGGERDADDGRPPIVRRGEYLVKHVALCDDCHTPRMADGTPNPAQFLAGASGKFRVPGLGADGGYGVVSPPNLTPDRDTGLGSWTDSEIQKAFLDGVAKDGKALYPLMPYYVLHNMSEEDARAVVAYLRTVPAVRNAVLPRNFDVAVPALPLAAGMIPYPALEATDPNYESAMRGRYLAGNIGICMDCHTEHTMEPVPLDRDKLFAGGRTFVAADVGIPAPPFPTLIYSANITPHPSGLEGWTAAAVAALLQQGTDDDGVRICPPMPVGPQGAFGGLTNEDARDIGNYLVYLPPVANALPEACHDEMRRDGGKATVSSEELLRSER